MFFEGMRLERQLMRHAADRLSIRWFLGFDLGEPLPDQDILHSMIVTSSVYTGRAVEESKRIPRSYHQ